ncbi:MAG: 16S rRNA (cytidine(1402)-2'-O)-methyltransferase [Ignavibacteriales bacterium]|nr:16S rRNA (cytidine(1402)-2'-O)-methyltransferase [Ignavibacteriales bacterium]
MTAIPGTLYIVSTPIGNLEDISARGVSILSSVDLIAAEDTRKTKILLNHFNISKPLISYYNFNETKRVPELISKLIGGLSIALVSDAGTPGISDPSYRIINAAIEQNIPIVAIPGATAFLPALIVSGFNIDRFLFEGFLPVKKGRKTFLEKLSTEPHTIVFYESPHRLLRTLNDLKQYFGNRDISISRETTKKFEETFRGKISESITHFSKSKVRGELVLVVEGTPKGKKPLR